MSLEIEINQEGDKENEQPMHEAKKRRKEVVQAIRQSDRIKNKDISVATKAEIRTSKKNLGWRNGVCYKVKR